MKCRKNIFLIGASLKYLDLSIIPKSICTYVLYNYHNNEIANYSR